MRRLPPVFVAGLAATMVAVACAAPDATSPEPQIWSLAPEPDLVIGEDGTPEGELNRVVAVLPLRGGDLAVADAGDAVIKVFSETGAYQRSIGRRGAGPGEFQSIGWVALEADTLVVYDAGQRRITLVRTDGTVLVTVHPRAEGGLIAPMPRGRLSDGTWLLMGTHPMPPPTTASVFRDTMFFGTMPPSGVGPVHVVEKRLSPAMARIPGTTGGVAPSYFFTWPVAFRIGARFGVADPYDGTLNLYDADGTPAAQMALPLPRVPITPEELNRLREEATAHLSEPSRSRVAVRYSAEVTPEAVPAFRSILVDGNDLIWLEEWQHEPLSMPRFHVVNASGEWRATVTMPPAFQPLTIGPDWVLGIHRDEDGVQRVMRYRLDRG